LGVKLCRILYTALSFNKHYTKVGKNVFRNAVQINFKGTDHATPLYRQKLVLTSPTSGGLSVGIDRSRTKATELVILKYGITC
jgi:hypothetical protein